MRVKRLIDICLTRIISLLDRINLAYTTSQDEEIRRNIEILRGIYSGELIKLLCERNLMKEEYTKLLLNRYVENLDFKELPLDILPLVAEVINEVGPSLKKLTIPSFDVRMVPFVYITVSWLSNIRVLHVECYFTDEMLRNMSSRCASLTELNIAGSYSVTNRGIEYLLYNESLRMLDIRKTSVNDVAVQLLLDNLPSLEVVAYDRLPLVLYNTYKIRLERGDPNREKTYNLSKMDVIPTFNSPFFEHILIVCCTLCPNVKELTFPACNKYLHLCWNFSQLQRLTLINVSDMCEGNFIIGPENGIYFMRAQKLKRIVFRKQLQNLRILHLIGTEISASNLIENFPRLDDLYIEASLIETADNYDYNFRNLKKITVTNMFSASDEEVTSSMLQCVFSSPEIEGKISWTFPVMNLQFLLNLPRETLTHITFHRSHINIKLMDDIIKRYTSLQKINTTQCFMRFGQHSFLWNFPDSVRSNLEAALFILRSDRLGADYVLDLSNAF